MHLALSLALVLLGLAAFALWAFTARVVTGYYQYGTELILHATLIAAGVGLYFGRPFGRVLTLAWLRIASWAIVVVPIGLVLWLAMLQGGSAKILQVLGQVFFALMLLSSGPGDRPAISPLWYVAGALAALSVLSFVCARLYRRVAGGTAPISARATTQVRVVIVALLLTAFATQHRIVFSEFKLPMALRSAALQEQSRKWREEALRGLVGEPFAVDQGKGLAYVLANHHALIYVDLASGQATKKELPADMLKDPVQSGQRRAARFSADGPIFWSNWTNELVDLHSGRRVKPALEQTWNQYLAVGFADGARRFLLFDRINMRIVAVETASGRVLFSTDVTPAAGFSSDQNRIELQDRAAARSAFSGDRTRLAWFYLDTLYVLDTASGALESLPAAGARDANVHFSHDSLHVLTHMPYDPRPGALVDIASKTALEHDVHVVDVLHFSAAHGLIALLPSERSRPNESRISRWILTNLGTPVWTVTVNGRLHLRASADARRLFAYNPATHQLESAPIDGITGNTPLEFTPFPAELPPGQLRWLSYFPDGGGTLVPVQSPKMAIVRLAPSGIASSRIVDFTPFGPTPQ